MAFPMLFPTGVPMLKQPRLYEVSMQEYALHLIRFHDNRFAQHPRFRYYLYNLMMRHRSQATAAVFVKRNLADTLPATVSALRTQLSHLPDSRVADHAMRFASSLRGTRSCCTCCLWVSLQGPIKEQDACFLHKFAKFGTLRWLASVSNSCLLVI